MANEPHCCARPSVRLAQCGRRIRAVRLCARAAPARRRGRGPGRWCLRSAVRAQFGVQRVAVEPEFADEFAACDTLRHSRAGPLVLSILPPRFPPRVTLRMILLNETPGLAVLRAFPSRAARRLVMTALAAAFAAASLHAPAEAASPSPLGPDHRVQLLTQPRAADAAVIATDYFARNLATLGLTAADLSTLEIVRRYQTDGLGTNLFYQQGVAGIPVFNAITSVHVLDSGAILAVNNTAVGDVATKLSATQPVVTAQAAFRTALQHVGIAPPDSALVVLRTLDVARQGVAFTGTGATERPVPVRLIYVPRPDGTVRLAWELYVMASANEVWYMLVDALDAAVLEKHNLVHSLDQYRVYGFNAESPISTESPVDLHHDLTPETDDDAASPTGWHSGTSTTGNNVKAVEDRDATNTAGYQPTGIGAPGNLVFDFAHDDLRNPCQQPTPASSIASKAPNLQPCDPYTALNGNTNLQSSIVNLFYWNNILHDVMFHYAFTEGAGNFQQTNFTTEGTGRDFDPVFAQAQDGSGSNNANFFTPPDDGVTPILLPPAMQMFEWSPPAVVRVNLPVDFDDFDDGDNVLSAATASFGPSLKSLTEAQRTGDLELGNDNSTGDGTGTVNDGCQALVGFTSGRIALLERGGCEFALKVLNAQTAGAKGAVITNTLGREIGNGMGPGVSGAQVTIPSVMIGQTNGTRLKTAMTQGPVNLTLQILPVPNRDSDMDAGVIAHEYGHGVSNRLVGGPSSIACLINGQAPDPNTPGATIPIGEQMGEGWSDLYGLILTAQRTDTADSARGIGAYISYQNENGPGIRRFPYSRTFNVNPLTYANVATETAPHGVGTVWATMVWDMYWNLVDQYGFEPDLFKHTSSAGNVRTLHYLNNGLIVTKCRPSFVDGRNAILVAEAADGNTTDSCPIWRAFARRGLGVAAVNPSGGEDHRRVVADFTVPANCAAAGFAPQAQNDNYTTPESTRLGVAAPGVLVNDSDADGTPVTAALIDPPTRAESFTLNANGSFDYVPVRGFNGTDTFTYVAQSGGVSSNKATVSISVTAIDDPPVAVDDATAVAKNAPATAIPVLANDTDPDGGPKSIVSVTQPVNGTVVITGGGSGLTYEPVNGFCSATPDTFTYALNGGSTATVSVTVTCPADAPPVAVADTASVAEDSGATTIDVLANDTDSDGGPKLIVSATQPGNGTVLVNGTGSSLTFEPNANFCSANPQTFTYTLNGNSSATVSVTVICVDDAPVAVADAASVAEDSGATAIPVLANDTDVDGGPKTITSVTQPANGTVAITGGGSGLTFAPNANFCELDAQTFSYALNGGSSATVSITVTCVDDAPVAVADAASVAEDSGATAIPVLDNDTDVDLGPLTIVSVTQPANGTVVITNSGAGLTYAPNAGYCATTADTFTYTLNGGSSATVSVTVTCSDLFSNGFE